MVLSPELLTKVENIKRHIQCNWDDCYEKSPYAFTGDAFWLDLETVMDTILNANKEQQECLTKSNSSSN